MNLQRDQLRKGVAGWGKVGRNKGRLLRNEIITIIYDPENRQVQFLSKKFKLFQNNLPKENEYRVAIRLVRVGQILEIELIDKEEDE